jgi:hypothetical protein
MMDSARIPVDILFGTAEKFRKEGKKFVYTANLLAQVQNNENNYYPHCQHLLVERKGF